MPVLIARPASPGSGVLTLPEGVLDPGLAVLDTSTQNTVEIHNYLAAYYGRAHWSENWRGRWSSPALNPGQVEESAFVQTTVLEYLIVPRAPGLGLTVRYRIDSDAGWDLWVTANGATATTGVAIGGAVPGSLSLVYAAPAPDTLTLVTVELRRRLAGTWADIYQLSGRDADLTAVTLP